jgi:hypothetical protein
MLQQDRGDRGLSRWKSNCVEQMETFPNAGILCDASSTRQGPKGPPMFQTVNAIGGLYTSLRQGVKLQGKAKRQAIRLAMLLCPLAASLHSQALGQPNGFVPGGPELGGWRLYSVAATGLYYYGAPPISNGVSPVNYNQSGGGGGVSAALGWTRVRERTSASLSYNASYYATTGDSSWRSLNQQLALSLRQKLSGKWSLDAAVAGTVATSNEYFYSPTSLSAFASVPSTFDDLSKAFLGGTYANNQLAFATLAAPGTDPAARLLYGYRSFTASGSLGFSYRPSQRWTWSFGVSGSRVESLDGGTSNGGAGAPIASPVIPSSTLLSASISAEYSLTPRTSMSFLLGDNKVVSTVEDMNNTSGTVTLRRALSRRWLGR